MKKFIFFIMVGLSINTIVFGSCLLIPTELNDRIDANQTIIEGQIIEKFSYWGIDDLNIYTANKVLVYKVFKGEVSSDEILVITEGGTIGDTRHEAYPNLSLQIGQVGILFINGIPDIKMCLDSPLPKEAQFYPTASSQAFVHYDVKSLTASDPFFEYESIEQSVKSVIVERTGNQPVVLNNFTLNKKDKTNTPSLRAVNATIDCIYPNSVSAGTGTIVAIEGSNFGSYNSNSKIEVRNANSGGTTFLELDPDYIIAWQDDLIEIEIPPKAGSGTVKVTSSSGSVESETSLRINFGRATLGSDRIPTFLVDDNGSGGYDFAISTNSASGGVNLLTSPGYQAILRAVDNVREYAGFNINITGNTTVNVKGDDGVNVIMFDNDSDPLGAPVGLMKSQFTKCGGVWEVTGMDLTFRRNNTGTPAVNWYFDAATNINGAIDFESVAIHELMHGAQLKHVIEPSAVMFYSYGYNVIRRDLSVCEDLAGAEWVMEESSNYNPLCDNLGTYQLPSEFVGFDSYDFDTCPSDIECGGMNAQTEDGYLDVKIFLEGFSVNGSNLSNAMYNSGLLSLEQPFSEAPYNYNGTESFDFYEDFPGTTVDWVLVQLRDPEDMNTVIAERAALLDYNGQLMDIDGIEGVFFPELGGRDFYIAVYHQSHLSVISSTPHTMGDFNNINIYDFTESETQAMGVQQLKDVDGNFCLISGDYDGNGIINSLDYNKWASENASVGKYLSWDGDGNGIINNIDYNLWTNNKSRVGHAQIQF